MKRFAQIILATSCLLGLAAPTQAAVETYKIDPVHSSVGFSIRHFFSNVPGAFTKFGGAIVVDRSGNYVCHRHALVPHPCHMWFRFSVLTSSLFMRRRVIHERGLFFDTRWRVVGDLGIEDIL